MQRLAGGPTASRPWPLPASSRRRLDPGRSLACRMRVGDSACVHVPTRALLLNPRTAQGCARACSCVRGRNAYPPNGSHAHTHTVVLVCCSPLAQSRAGHSKPHQACCRAKQAQRMLRCLLCTTRRRFAGPSCPRLHQTAATPLLGRPAGRMLLGRRACREWMSVLRQAMTRSCARARGRRIASATDARMQGPTGLLPPPPPVSCVSDVAALRCACSRDTCCVLHASCSTWFLCTPSAAVGVAVARHGPRQMQYCVGRIASGGGMQCV